MAKKLFDYQQKIVDEIWKDIHNYEGLYQVSNMGRVKRVFINDKTRNQYSYDKDELILKPQRNGTGYLWVRLYKNKQYKKYYVHSLVADTFLVKKDNNVEVNHKDKNTQNNCVDNLEFCTHKRNMEHGKGIFIIYVPKLKECIRFESMNDCAKYLKITTRKIKKYRKGHLLYEEDLNENQII